MTLTGLAIFIIELFLQSILMHFATYLLLSFLLPRIPLFSVITMLLVDKGAIIKKKKQDTHVLVWC
jgi:hypothetical protein